MMKSDSRKSLKLGGIESNVKIVANTAEELIFLQNIMDETFRKGSSAIVLKYTPTTNMTSENVQLSINFNTQFIFK